MGSLFPLTEPSSLFHSNLPCTFLCSRVQPLCSLLLFHGNLDTFPSCPEHCASCPGRSQTRSPPGGMRLGGNGSFPGPRGCPDPRTRLTTVGIHSGIGANQRQLPGAHPVGILRQGLSPTCASKGAGVEEKPHLRNVLQVLLQGLGTGNPSGSAPVIHQELALVRLGMLSQTMQRSLPPSFLGDP